MKLPKLKSKKMLKVREGSGRFRKVPEGSGGRSCRLCKFCRVLDMKMSFMVSFPEEKAEGSGRFKFFTMPRGLQNAGLSG